MIKHKQRKIETIKGSIVGSCQLPLVTKHFSCDYYQGWHLDDETIPSVARVTSADYDDSLGVSTINLSTCHERISFRLLDYG